jgi:outer membrane receptor protein involved in Fe transport
MTVTLGASGDFFNPASGKALDRAHEFNPKFGITWNVLPKTTLRAAAFRAFRRSLLTEQTLEPTQVAGFNQFYDDIETTESWRYGVAIDQKFSEAIFGGVESSWRDLRVPVPFTNTFTGVNEVMRRSWNEYLTRLYLFWTPHDSLALSAQYLHERFTRGTRLNFGLRESTTQRVPLGLKLFHPTGLGVALTTTYLHQDGEFQRGGICCESGRSDFWLVDAAITYRLPKRYGFVAIGATNLLDRKFKYQETDFNNPTILPDRMFFAKLTLAFQ